MDKSFRDEQVHTNNYMTKTPSYYLDKISPDILASFTNEQLQAITSILERAIPKPSPKIVDFKFTVDLIFSRFYVALFVGKERRRKQRHQVTEGISRIGNAIAAVILLLAANLVISALIVLFAYLFKSAIGLNFFPGHISESFKKF